MKGKEMGRRGAVLVAHHPAAPPLAAGRPRRRARCRTVSRNLTLPLARLSDHRSTVLAIDHRHGGGLREAGSADSPSRAGANACGLAGTSRSGVGVLLLRASAPRFVRRQRRRLPHLPHAHVFAMRRWCVRRRHARSRNARHSASFDFTRGGLRGVFTRRALGLPGRVPYAAASQSR
jgi:hypothetical protein